MGTVLIEGNTVFNIRPQKYPKLHEIQMEYKYCLTKNQHLCKHIKVSTE
jgi:hypothetical protein